MFYKQKELNQLASVNNQVGPARLLCYQLQEATYGQVNNGRFTPASNQAYAVQNLSYDLNGNLLGLQRRDQNGNLLHDFDGKYYYEGNTNQLSSVTGYASYTYNAIGQMTYEKKGEQVQQLDYDVSGKVREVKDGSGEAKFIYTYDDRGYRVKKEDKQTQQATYYIRDASGMLLSIYEQDLKVAGSMPEVTEVPIYGSNRLGFFRPDPIELSEYLACFDDSQTRSAYENKSYILVEGAEMTLSEGFEVSYQSAHEQEFFVSTHEPEGQTTYELKDHLGSVRARIQRKIGGGIDLLDYSSYYPYGLAIGSLSMSSGTPKRFGYQSSFAEDEVNQMGYLSFALRQYDPIIGRWLSPDPYGQYASPYLAMGNNPVNFIDPDGGLAVDPTDPVQAFIDAGGTVLDDVVVVRASSLEWMNKLGWLNRIEEVTSKAWHWTPEAGVVFYNEHSSKDFATGQAPGMDRKDVNYVEAMNTPLTSDIGSKHIPSRGGRGSGPAPTNLASKLKEWMEEFKFGVDALDKTNATSVLEPATPALQPSTPSGAEGMEVHSVPEGAELISSDTSWYSKELRPYRGPIKEMYVIDGDTIRVIK